MHRQWLPLEARVVNFGRIQSSVLHRYIYICHQCHQTFTETKGAVFYRLLTAQDTVALVLTLLAHGCPLQAIVAAFELDERTVQAWQARAGQHCEQVHRQLVQQPRDLGQPRDPPSGSVQADEIRVKQQGQIVWLAMAVQVATQLWLDAVLSPQRDIALITASVQLIRQCALCRPLLGWRLGSPIIVGLFKSCSPIKCRRRSGRRPSVVDGARKRPISNNLDSYIYNCYNTNYE